VLRLQLSGLKPAQKTAFIEEVFRSGAGRARRGTAKKGAPAANVTWDMRPPPEDGPSDSRILYDHAETLPPDHALRQVLAARSRAFSRLRRDGSGNRAVPLVSNSGCLRAFREGACKPLHLLRKP
jgi:hypothetical protein